MPDSFYKDLMDTDLGALDTLADQWLTVHGEIKGLSQRVHDEMLVPLRNKGYWEGAAAPYAWKMIDDIERQIAAATKVADATRSMIDDAVGELKAVQRDLKDAVRRAGEQGVQVGPDGAVTPYMSRDTKLINAVQDEINDIVKRGITADQNLAFSLMSNIGTGQWFNDKPKHRDINSTNKIGEDEYNELNLALQGKNPHPQIQGDDPYSLGWDWVTGDGARDRTYHAGDKMTELIRASESMKQLRADTLHEWQTKGNAEGNVAYSISEDGKIGAAKKLVTTDLPAIITGDPEHLGEAFVGSYNLGYKVKGEDPDGSLIVEYTLENSTSNSSFLHYIGYYDWLENLNRDDGAFSSVDQKIVWAERIPPTEKQR
ncbi:hypothetical protein ACIBI4_24105 [Streptomyces sp. NPDC050418]|uniref:hypothetical protein n=1 Tax=Streptomyces sp. NPDC050418 TaxID=3365612 RepID=UPI00378EA295